ncbi:DNA phosphorothioation-associated protein 4 [Bacillus salacetis]|uniref:DNA phosphorothioation-associated protein 4 n=1 Tax=Bacillus salacetis TaxID=2315464 RepID=UPI003B9FA6A2
MAYRRIRRPKNQEHIYKELTDTDEFGIFQSYKDLFMMAGIVGFVEKKRKSFEGSLEGINWNIFNLDTDEAIINAVALNETGDQSIINTIDGDSFDRKITIFEEYAAGGAEVLYSKLKDHPRNAVDILYEYMLSMEKVKSESDRDVEDIRKIILSFD